MVMLQSVVFSYSCLQIHPAVDELLELQNLIIGSFLECFYSNYVSITLVINQPVGKGKYQSVMKDPSVSIEGHVLAPLKCSHELWHETIL